VGCNQPVRDEQGGYDGGQNHQPSRAAIKLPRARWQLPSPRTRHPKQPHRPLHRAGRRPPPPARHGAHTRRRAQGVRREHCVVGRGQESARLAQQRGEAAMLRSWAQLPRAACRRWGSSGLCPLGARTWPCTRLGKQAWVPRACSSRPDIQARIDVHRTRCTRGDLHVTDRDRSKTWQ